MKVAKLKVILGYAAASLSVLVLLFALIGEDFLSEKLVAVTGIKISPWFSGGEVVRKIDCGEYQMRIHRPVFDALIGERKEGFVQVDWGPPDSLPATIDADVDINSDGHPDFHIRLETQTLDAVLAPNSPEVIGLKDAYRLKSSLAIRVGLKNPSR